MAVAVFPHIGAHAEGVFKRHKRSERFSVFSIRQRHERIARRGALLKGGPLANADDGIAPLPCRAQRLLPGAERIVLAERFPSVRPLKKRQRKHITQRNGNAPVRLRM